MYDNNDYEEEEQTTNSGSFLGNFYNNNKKLIWILVVVIAFLLIASLVTKTRDNKNPVQTNEEIVVKMKDDAKKVEVTKRNSVMLHAEVSNNKQPSFKWESSDKNIATVSDNGLVYGVNLGTAIITGTYVDEKTNKPYHVECEVFVYEGDPSIKITSVEFPNGDLMMNKGDREQLSLTVSPSRAIIANRTYESDKPSVVEVDENGVVTAKGIGEATITVYINKDSNGLEQFEDSIDVYVLEKKIKKGIIVNPTALNFNSSFEKIEVGDGIQLDYFTDPEDVSNNNFTWTSEYPNIAEVSQTGYVKAKSVGTTKIKVEALNGKSDEVVVEVVSGVVDIANIWLPVNRLNMKVGEQQVVTPVISPDNATIKTLKFESSNNAVVSAIPNQGGIACTVFAHKAGNETIKITSQDGKVSVTLEVSITDDNIVPIDEPTNIENNNNENNNNNNSNSSSSSSGNSVNITSSQNNVTLTYEQAEKNVGTAPITLTFKLGSNVARVKYCLAAVTSGNAYRCKPADVAYNNTTITLAAKAIYRIRVIKYDSSGNEIVGTSSNYIDGALECYVNTKGTSNSGTNQTGTTKYATKPTVASHCKPNLVYSGYNMYITEFAGEGYTFSNNYQKNAGTYDVVATLKPGYKWSNGKTNNVTIRCSISASTSTNTTVSVGKVSLNKTSASVTVGNTVTLTPTITPINATNKNVTWTSSNTSVATVTNGVVKGVKAGNATITVRTADGSKTATCAVTVTNPTTTTTRSTSTSINPTTTTTRSTSTNINLNWTKHGTKSLLYYTMQEMNYGTVSISSSKSMKKIYYCITDRLAIVTVSKASDINTINYNNYSKECSIDRSTDKRYKHGETIDNNFYYGLTYSGSPSYYKSINETKNTSINFLGYALSNSAGSLTYQLPQRMCFEAQFSDNTYSDKECIVLS